MRDNRRLKNMGSRMFLVRIRDRSLLQKNVDFTPLTHDTIIVIRELSQQYSRPNKLEPATLQCKARTRPLRASVKRLAMPTRE